MQRNRTMPRILGTILIGLILFFIINKILYTHSHILSNGTVITHAHPYDKSADNSPFKSHQHGSVELVILSAVSFLPAIYLTFFLAIISQKTYLIIPFLGEKYLFNCWRKINGRAPPCLA